MRSEGAATRNATHAGSDRASGRCHNHVRQQHYSVLMLQRVQRGRLSAAMQRSCVHTQPHTADRPGRGAWAGVWASSNPRRQRRRGPERGAFGRIAAPSAESPRLRPNRRAFGRIAAPSAESPRLRPNRHAFGRIVAPSAESPRLASLGGTPLSREMACPKSSCSTCVALAHTRTTLPQHTRLRTPCRLKSASKAR
jgi:hypothetical protein